MKTVGTSALVLPALSVLQRFRLPACDLFLVVVEGRLSVTDELGGATWHRPGDLVVCPRGRARTLGSDRDPVRVLAVAMPAGPEAALSLLLGEGEASGERLQRAADAGIEVLLDT